MNANVANGFLPFPSSLVISSLIWLWYVFVCSCKSSCWSFNNFMEQSIIVLVSESISEVRLNAPIIVQQDKTTPHTVIQHTFYLYHNVCIRMWKKCKGSTFSSLSFGNKTFLNKYLCSKLKSLFDKVCKLKTSLSTLGLMRIHCFKSKVNIFLR